MLTDRQNGIIRKKINGDFEEIWKRLLDIVAAEKIPVFAVIDHKSCRRNGINAIKSRNCFGFAPKIFSLEKL